MQAAETPNASSAERALLEQFLEANRAALVATLEGLSTEQARRRLVPSLTTPLGLVKHAGYAEQVWFHASLDGQDRAALGLARTNEPSFELTEADTVESVAADYQRICAEARTIASRHSLDDLAQHVRRGTLSLRWIYLHMIEELARHAGHGDILREQLLAEYG